MLCSVTAAIYYDVFSCVNGKLCINRVEEGKNNNRIFTSSFVFTVLLCVYFKYCSAVFYQVVQPFFLRLCYTGLH